MRYVNSHSKVVSDVSAEKIWAVWSDIDKRTMWDSDTEWVTMWFVYCLSKQNYLFR